MPGLSTGPTTSTHTDDFMSPEGDDDDEHEAQDQDPGIFARDVDELGRQPQAPGRPEQDLVIESHPHLTGEMFSNIDLQLYVHIMLTQCELGDPCDAVHQQNDKGFSDDLPDLHLWWSLLLTCFLTCLDLHLLCTFLLTCFSDLHYIYDFCNVCPVYVLATHAV